MKKTFIRITLLVLLVVIYGCSNVQQTEKDVVVTETDVDSLITPASLETMRKESEEYFNMKVEKTCEQKISELEPRVFYKCIAFLYSEGENLNTKNKSCDTELVELTVVEFAACMNESALSEITLYGCEWGDECVEYFYANHESFL